VRGLWEALGLVAEQVVGDVDAPVLERVDDLRVARDAHAPGDVHGDLPAGALLDLLFELHRLLAGRGDLRRRAALECERDGLEVRDRRIDVVLRGAALHTVGARVPRTVSVGSPLTPTKTDTERSAARSVLHHSLVTIERSLNRMRGGRASRPAS